MSREVSEIKGTKKAGNIVLCVISALVLLCTLFLVLVSVIFYGDNSAPEIFGHRIYLVKTDAFSLVNNGTALIAQTVPDEEIKAGNIVIFLDDEDKNTIGEIREVTYSDGVYTYRTRLPNNSETVVGQSKIVAKGIYVSDAVGGLIGFALSPAGVGVIAILPCSLIIVLEVLNFIKSRRLSQQEEEAFEREADVKTVQPSLNREEPEERDFSDLRSASQPEHRFTSQEVGLFQPPKAGNSFRQTAQPAQKAPISGKELEKIIMETKAEHRRGASVQQPAVQKERPVQQPPVQKEKPAQQVPVQRERTAQTEVAVQREQAAKAAASARAADRYRQIQEQTELPKAPAKSAVKTDTDTVSVAEPKPVLQPEQKTYSPRKAVDDGKLSPLDRLLQEEQESDEHYDIDDILRSLEKH